MAAGKKQHHQQQQQHEGAVAAAAEPSVARRLWRVVRAVLYMLRRGVPSGRKLAMDLHLLLHRGKIAAGKALGDRFLASHSHHGHGAFSSSSSSYAAAGASGGGPFSCAALDPSLAVHEPSRRRREVEFSCSNTPSSASGGLGFSLLAAAKRRRHRSSRRRQQQHQQKYRDDDDADQEDCDGYLMQCYSSYDAAAVARVFEMLSDASDDDDDDDRRLFSDDAVPVAAASATPSPAAQAQLPKRSSSISKKQHQQQGRVAVAAVAAGSSPADGGAQAQVDRRADEFIRRFYEQLRAQRSAASTPDNHYSYKGTGAAGASPYAAAARGPRRLAAGIA